MSLREKQLWISLIAGAAIWVAYAVWAWPILTDAAHPHPARATGLGFLCALAAFAVAEAVLGGFVAWFQRRHRPAQDRALTEAGLIAGQVALLVLFGFLALALVGLWLAGAAAERAGGAAALDARMLLWLAHAVLAALIVSEGVRALVTLLLVRRGR